MPKDKESKRQAFMASMKAGLNAGAKPKKLSRGKKLKRTIKELIGGSKTYLPKKPKAKSKPKPKPKWKTPTEIGRSENLADELTKLRRKSGRK